MRAAKPRPSVSANSPARSQYEADRNRIRAISRSTSMRMATLWTRPAERRGAIFRQRIGETS